MVTARPWRAVVGGPGETGTPLLVAGRGSMLGGDSARRNRWWKLRLECGHDATRQVRYGSPADGRARSRGGTQHRARADVLPPPRRVRCETCPIMTDH